jgi:endo-1,4-beta-xylanase
MNKDLSRKDFLKLAGVTSAGLAFSACGVKVTELPTTTPIPPTGTLIPSTGTPLPTDTLTPTSTLTSTPTLPLEQLPQTKRALTEFVQAFQAVGADISTDQLIQKGLEIHTTIGKDEKQYDIAFVHIEGSAQWEGDYPLMIKMSDEWEYAYPNDLDEIKGIPTIYITGKYDEVLQLDKGEFSGLGVQWPFAWNIVRPSVDKYDFGMADYAFQVKSQSGMKRATEASLIWGYMDVLPNWLKDGQFTKDELKNMLIEHIEKVVAKYKGITDTWIVVNEPYGDVNDVSFWDKQIGRKDTSWIEQSFVTARKEDSNASLILNDFGIEFNNIGKFQEIYNLCKSLKQKDIPIDGIGFQMHIYGNDLISGRYTFEQLQESIRQFMALGLKVYFTELDVDMSGYKGTAKDRLKAQSELYFQVAKIASDEGVISITIFGVKDDTSWIVENYPNKKETAIPILYDDKFNKKISYFAFSRGLLNGLQQ